MSNSAARSTPPSRASADLAARALMLVELSLARSAHADRFRFRIEEGNADLELPREAVELLATGLSHMAAGRAVFVVSEQAELTTQQAAERTN